MELSTRIDADPAQVWAIATDLDASPERISAIQAIERTGGPAFGPGTRWRETRQMMGQERTEEMEIVDVDAPTSYVIASEGGGAEYRTTMSVEPEDDGSATRLRLRFETRPTSRVGALVATTTGPLVRWMTRRALERDLADIKASAEAGETP